MMMGAGQRATYTASPRTTERTTTRRPQSRPSMVQGRGSLINAFNTTPRSGRPSSDSSHVLRSFSESAAIDGLDRDRDRADGRGGISMLNGAGHADFADVHFTINEDEDSARDPRDAEYAMISSVSGCCRRCPVLPTFSCALQQPPLSLSECCLLRKHNSRRIATSARAAPVTSASAASAASHSSHNTHTHTHTHTHTSCAQPSVQPLLSAPPCNIQQQPNPIQPNQRTRHRTHCTTIRSCNFEWRCTTMQCTAPTPHTHTHTHTNTHTHTHHTHCSCSKAMKHPVLPFTLVTASVCPMP